jgi:hypothetical protein
MSKNMLEPEWQQMTSQYGAYALHAGSTHPGTRTHTRALSRTHRQICNTFCNVFSRQLLRERASMLRYSTLPVLL